MPNFDKDHRVYTDSLIELSEGINDVVIRLAKGKIRFGAKRKINKARMLNALYLWFLRQPHEVQDQIVGETIPLLKQHYDSKERLVIEPASVPPTGRRHAYAMGHTVVNVDSHGKDQIPTDANLPKKRR